MNGKRLDLLLEVMLATGSLPLDVSEAERAEVMALIGVAATVRSATPTVEDEAIEAMPIARARFARYLSNPQAFERNARRGGQLGWRAVGSTFGRMAMTRAAAAVALVAILTLVVSQSLTSHSGTASAQVLTPGDYVQLEGTVITSRTAQNGVQQVRLQSDAGQFEIELSSESSVVAGQAPSDTSAVQLGDRILVGGVVNDGGGVGARTLVVSNQSGAKTPPPASPRANPKVKTADRPLEGQIVSFSLSADLKTARVVLDDGKGGLFLARINRKSVEALLLQSVNALGAHVRLVSGGAPGLFGLTVATDATPAATSRATTVDRTPAKATPSKPPQSKAQFVEVKGTILARENNILRVQTERGAVLVVLRPDTRILPGDTGATLEALRSGAFNPVGYALGAAGGFDAKSDRISADLVVLGPKSGQ